MQITGEGNVDVEKMYNAYEVEKVIYSPRTDASPKLEQPTGERHQYMTQRVINETAMNARKHDR